MPQSTSKRDLLHRLVMVQNNFAVGMAGLFLLSKPNAPDELEGAVYGFVPHDAEPLVENMTVTVPVFDVANSLRENEIRDGILRDFREMLLRTTLAETLEFVRDYCEGSGQSDRLFEAPWYNFARLIRNGLVHDGTVRFDKKAKPPIVYRHWRFEESDRGKPLSEILELPSTSALPVLEDAQRFVEKGLD